MKNTKIIEAFNQFKTDKRLAHESLWAGCTERTKIICDILNQRGEEAGYLCLPKEGWTDENLSCRAKLKNGKIEEFFWIRHFVPFVFNEQNEIIIFDICLMDGPERLEDWRKHILFDGKPLKKDNYSLNHPKNVSGLNMVLRYRDPYENLASLAHLFPERNIIPHQIKSKWLQEQKQIRAIYKKRTHIK